jgi:hypothetical protein
MKKPIRIDRSKESISLAEQTVLASIMFDHKTLPAVSAILSPDDFANGYHKLIYQAMFAIEVEGNVIDSVSVTEYLHRTGKLDGMGGPVFIANLADNVGSASQAVYYAKRVKQAALSRQYASDCQRLLIEAQQAAAGELNLPDVIVKHDETIRKLADDCEILNANQIDYISANPDNIYEIKWPLGLHEWVNLFPKNIAILAGASNAGKTAFLLNVAYMNRNRHKVRYLSSEMGPEELRLRLQLFGYPIADWKPVEFWDRSSDFAPLIEPDSLNIVDFLEIYDNFFTIGAEIKQIYDRLKTGIAIIAIQKKSNSQFARGGEFTLEKARLYITIDPGVCKIIKGKNWAQPGENPKDKEFFYKLYHGCHFYV